MALCYYLFPGLLIDNSSLSLAQSCLPCGSFVQTDYPTNSWTVLSFLCYFYQLLVKRAAANHLEKKVAFLSQSLKLFTLIHCPGWYSSTQVRLTVNTFFPIHFTVVRHFEGSKKMTFKVTLYSVNTSKLKEITLFHLFRKIVGITMCYINVIVSTYSLSNQQKQSLNQCHFSALK